jgi:hypothetical protein
MIVHDSPYRGQLWGVLLTLSAKRKGHWSNHSDLRHILVAHTGQSSQLFVDGSGRNAQFLTTVAGAV